MEGLGRKMNHIIYDIERLLWLLSEEGNVGENGVGGRRESGSKGLGEM